MPVSNFRIAPKEDGWGIWQSDGSVAGPYATKEAALEAAFGAASNALKDGHGVNISVPSRAEGDSNLGAS